MTTDSLTYSTDGTHGRFANANAIVESWSNPITDTDSTISSLGGHHVKELHAGHVQLTASDTVTITSDMVSFASRIFTPDTATGQLASFKLGTAATTFRYNTDGMRTFTQWSGGGNRSEAYTSLHDDMITGFSSIALNETLLRSYWRDSLDRLSMVNLPVGTNNEGKQYVFSFDSVGQLQAWAQLSACTGVVEDTVRGFKGTGCTLNSTTTYSYDAAGNRTSQGGTYSPSGNHAVTFGAYHLTYDNDGELTQKHDTVTGNIFNYSWSADGRLLKVQHTLGSSSDSVEFAYNALGQLARRTTNGTIDRYYVYEGDQLLAELNGGFHKVADYAYTSDLDMPVAVTDSAGTTAYTEVDQVGNVIGQHDGAGNLLGTVAYDPWGAPTDSGTMRGSLRWKGLHYESGTSIGDKGLYYMRARWYDPDLGRFLSEDPDPTGGSQNQYIFAANDPIDGIDPGGTCELWYHLLVALNEDGSYATDDEGNLVVIQILGTFWVGKDCGRAGGVGGGGGPPPKPEPKPKPAPTCKLVPPTGDFKPAPGVDARFSPNTEQSLSVALQQLNAEGIVPVITSGYRSPFKTAGLSSDRTAVDPAKISWHEVGEAVDFGTNSNAGNNDAIRMAMTQAGFVWGGSFVHPGPDPVHYQTEPKGTKPSLALVRACATAAAGD